MRSIINSLLHGSISGYQGLKKTVSLSTIRDTSQSVKELSPDIECSLTDIFPSKPVK